jgi:hypothetical protein
MMFELPDDRREYSRHVPNDKWNAQLVKAYLDTLHTLHRIERRL